MRSSLGVAIILLSMASAQPVVAAEASATTITAADRDRRLMELFDKKAELEKQKAEAEADIQRHMPEFKDEQDIDRVITGPGKSAKPGELDHIPWTSGPQSIKKEQLDAAIKRKADVEAALKAVEKQIDVVTYTPVSAPPDAPTPMTPAAAPTIVPALPKSEAKSPAAGGSPFDDIQEIIAQSTCDALRSDFFKTSYRRADLEDELYDQKDVSPERKKEINSTLDALEPEYRRLQQKLKDEGCIPAPAPQKEASPAQSTPQGSTGAPAPGAVAALPKPPGPRTPQPPAKTKAVQEADTSAKSEPPQGDDCDTLVKQVWAADADLIRYSREIREADRDTTAADLMHKVAKENAQKVYDECRAKPMSDWIGCKIEANEPIVAARGERTRAAQRGMDAVEGYRTARESLNQFKQAYAEKKCKSGDGGTPDAGRRPPAGPTQASLAPPSLLPPLIVDLTPPQRGPVPPQQSGPTLPPPKLPAPAGAKPPQAASAPACPAGNFDAQCTAPQSPNASSTGWSTTELMNCVTLQRIQEREKQGWTCTRKAAQACNDLAAIQKAGNAPASGGTMTCDKDAKGCQTNCRWVTTPTTLKASITPALLAPPVLPAPHAAPAPALLPPSLLPPVAVGPPRHTVPQPPQHASAPHVVPQPPHVVPRPPAQKKKRHVQRRQRHAPVSDYDEAANTAAVIGAIGAIIGAMGSGPSYGGGHGGGYRGHTAPAPAMRRH